MTKSEFRRRARTLREAHAGDAPPPSFLPLLRQHLPQWETARVVALYLAAPAEPPTQDLLQDRLAAGCTVALPVWLPEKNTYAWCRYSGKTIVRPGRFGIPEPQPPFEIIPTAEIALFILPGVLFDACGTRLGHGKGFIDRLLAGRNPAAPVVGLALPWQLSSETLPREPHDVPMSLVLSHPL